ATEPKRCVQANRGGGVAGPAQRVAARADAPAQRAADAGQHPGGPRRRAGQGPVGRAAGRGAGQVASVRPQARGLPEAGARRNGAQGDRPAAAPAGPGAGRRVRGQGLRPGRAGVGLPARHRGGRDGGPDARLRQTQACHLPGWRGHPRVPRRPVPQELLPGSLRGPGSRRDDQRRGVVPRDRGARPDPARHRRGAGEAGGAGGWATPGGQVRPGGGPDRAPPGNL
ncbi:MAG: hypothetical protein AVDCRST_MAG22-3251, partial [uncultured Rubrobacteraceae bacterium]